MPPPQRRQPPTDPQLDPGRPATDTAVPSQPPPRADAPSWVTPADQLLHQAGDLARQAEARGVPPEYADLAQPPAAPPPIPQRKQPSPEARAILEQDRSYRERAAYYEDHRDFEDRMRRHTNDALDWGRELLFEGPNHLAQTLGFDGVPRAEEYLRKDLDRQVDAAEARAHPRQPPYDPIEPSGPQKATRSPRPTLSQQQANDEADRAIRDRERALGEWPSPLNNAEADRRAKDLPIDGEPRQPGPHLLTPGGAQSLDQLRNGMGNDLSHRLAVDAHRDGHRNMPGVPWPDERPPRPYQPPQRPPAPQPPHDPVDRTEPQARHDPRPLDGQLATALMKIHDRLNQADRWPAAIACPPPFRGGGVRM